MTENERKSTRSYLYSLMNLNRDLNDMLDRKDFLMAKITSPSISYDKERVQTSGNKDRLGDIMAEITDLKAEADRMTDEYVDLKEKLRGEIGLLKNERYRILLTQKYIEEKKNSEIADINNMNYSTCRVTLFKGEESFFEENKHNILCNA